MSRYDEDLFENPFFVALQRENAKLFEKATTNRWIICIPKYFIISKVDSLTNDVFEDQILLPKEGSDEEFCTVSGYVPILFEETFYNSKDENYRVLCVDNFFRATVAGEISSVGEAGINPDKPPTTYQECMKLLWGHPGGTKTKENLDRALSSFNKSYQSLEGENLSNLQDAVYAQMTRLMQMVLKDPAQKRETKFSPNYMENLKVAVEMYMMNCIHHQLFSAITACVTTQDAKVNKMTRNLTDISLEQLGVRHEFERNLPLARTQLAKLNKYATPIGRLCCLKRVMSDLTKPSVTSASENEELVMTTDDFLPIWIFLIIRSQIPNWTANLMYMKHFHLAKHIDDDEFSFYLATVEAALDYITSGKVKQEALATTKKQNFRNQEHADPSGFRRHPSGGSSTREKFFQYVQYGDEAAVLCMLRKPKTTGDEVRLKLCHPLCSCEKCTELQQRNKISTGLVSPYTRDDMGHTALHIAALYGQAHLIDILVNSGALVDASNFLGMSPLHLACQKGYQNIVLLLVHFGADITMGDNDGNTPLHLCAANGHEDCVKAILFLDIVKNKLDVNRQNDMGDTPLHLAAKWGYVGIVSFLLESEADPSIRNRKKQLPLSLAQNATVQTILQLALDNPLPKHTKKTLQDSHPTGISGKSRQKEWSSQGYDIVDVKPIKRSVPLEGVAPTTTVVASLDQADERVREKLFKAIKDGDIPLVNFYFGWNTTSVEESEDENDSASLTFGDMCHPLCQCSKCQQIQKFGKSTSLNVNCTNSQGMTPLHVATLYEQVELVKLFISKGANNNIQTVKNISPLHRACYVNNKEIAFLLITNGASVNAKDSYGETALHLCCGKGSKEIAEYLLQNGAEVNVINVLGNTPLHNAVHSSHLDIVEFLLQHGADTNMLNNRGECPLQLAKIPQVENYLRSYSSVVNPSGCQVSTKGKLGIKELFAAFEEKDLKTLQNLNSSIQTFDRRSSLRRVDTLDKTDTQLFHMRHSFSIQNFNTGTLRHVDFVDKSDPLYIYSLFCQSLNTDVNSSSTETSGNTQESNDYIKNGENGFICQQTSSVKGSTAEKITFSKQSADDTNTEHTGRKGGDAFSSQPKLETSASREWKGDDAFISTHSSDEMKNEIEDEKTFSTSKNNSGRENENSLEKHSSVIDIKLTDNVELKQHLPSSQQNEWS
ncbi:hypothetical protein ACJMK2_010133 [Sinanodonta woodiana]|uniref:VPS9 domain-containing protein n=1 Tax=Sinanodonta woodiana TaxID=1069815 RepID=A0ABD3VED7_SINWO